MGRSKGGTNRYWTAEEKYRIIESALNFEKSTWDITRETGISNGMINNWIKKYRENGYDGLVNKKKPGNPMSSLMKRKI